MKPKDRWVIGIIVFAVVIIWFFLFGIGMLIDSSIYRNAMKNGISDFSYFISAIITWTPTNVGLLCIISGIAGRLGNMIINLPKNGEFKTSTLLYGSLTGLIIFIMFVSVLFLAVDDPFGSTSPANYTKLASTISLITFICEYNPTVFEKLMLRVGSNVAKPE
ncbi:MAG: hypothetical protein V4683_09965 [Bacteroidota bacterium]